VGYILYMATLDTIRKAMAASGRSRYEIAHTAGIAESQLSRFARGQARLSVETAERLADVLNLEIIVRPKRGKRRKGG